MNTKPHVLVKWLFAFKSHSWDMCNHFRSKISSCIKFSSICFQRSRGYMYL